MTGGVIRHFVATDRLALAVALLPVRVQPSAAMRPLVVGSIAPLCFAARPLRAIAIRTVLMTGIAAQADPDLGAASSAAEQAIVVRCHRGAKRPIGLDLGPGARDARGGTSPSPRR